MKVLLDACVIYPTVMREMILGVAEKGVFVPMWSERIIAEWLHAAARLGPDAQAQAAGEAALMASKWPEATVIYPPSLEARLWLPDPTDTHVLAAAIAGSTDGILTFNARDFPRNILAEEGVWRADPDGFLHGIWQAQPDLVEEVGRQVLDKARRLSTGTWEMRALLKKARLPRLAKALSQV
ncbi:RSP_2648 family PIN domain-containing protein [uncultured Roseovarius sp.]|uniref:RSP_2648 family PIN domain-containing protein n=1 Tax=uncultured Roseovarius sp. TaxID=293344 RepID=UPI0026180348|nr:PIN domain-containing protein [uncultured Roseovarius sp.]